MRTLLLSVALFSFAALLRAESEPTPIPYLSWQDVKALYPPKRYPGDWDCPKLESYPHEQELIKFCQRDLHLTLATNPDPFHRGHKLWPGNLDLNCITKDPESRIVYFVFSYDSEAEVDLFVVYYYDPEQERFILKSTR